MPQIHYNQGHSTLSSPERKQKIAERRADMPRIYRATYDKAVTGKSLRAAVNSFCVQCVMYQREEVRLCTSLECALWPYRPYRDKPKCRSKNTSEGLSFSAESKKSSQGDNYAR